LLATEIGLLKTNKDQLINDYYKGKWIRSLCHISASLYLVGLYNDELRVWDQEKEQEMCQIRVDQVCSIKRVMTTDKFILRTKQKGLKLLTINDLESKKIINVQHLLDVKDASNFNDSLQVFITPSQIVIAATQYEWD
jgi:hypothetical protein